MTFEEINLKFKIKFVFEGGGVPLPSTPLFNSLTTRIKYIKSLLNVRSLVEIFKRALDETPHRKKQLRLISDYFVHFL